MAKENGKSIKQRLSLGFFLVIVLFIAWGMISLKEMHTLANLSHTLYKHPLAVSNASLKAGLGITKMHRSMKDVVLLDSRSAITFAVNTVDEQENMVLKQLNLIRDKIIGSEGQELEAKARKLFIDWRNIREEVIELARSGQRDEAALITMGKGAAHVAKLEDRMLELTAYARNKADTFMQHSQMTHSRTVGISYILIVFGVLLSALIAFITIKHVLSAEAANQRLVSELNETIEEIKTLRGVLPICSYCKNIRNDAGQWDQLEEYIRDHSDAEFTHGICPECAKKHYPDFIAQRDNK